MKITFFLDDKNIKERASIELTNENFYFTSRGVLLKDYGIKVTNIEFDSGNNKCVDFTIPSIINFKVTTEDETMYGQPAYDFLHSFSTILNYV